MIKFRQSLTSKSMDSISISAICGSVLLSGAGEAARDGRLELLAFAEGGIDDIWKASRVKTDMVMRICLFVDFWRQTKLGCKVQIGML